MIHLKTSPIIDFSDLLSPSVGEVSNALEKKSNEFELTFLRPEMQVAQTINNRTTVFQKPQSPSEQFVTIKAEVEFNESDVQLLEVKDKVIELVDISNDDEAIFQSPQKCKHQQQPNHEINCIKKIRELEERMNSILKMCDSNKPTIKTEVFDKADDPSDVVNDILPPAEFSSVETVEPKIEQVWYACIFCSKKYYPDLPSLQAHIKRVHYLRALQLLHFAGKDAKDKLLEIWRQKNRRIEPALISQSRLAGSRRQRKISKVDPDIFASQNIQSTSGLLGNDPVVQNIGGPASTLSQEKSEKFFQQIREQQIRRHRFRPYTDPRFPANCRSPMSLPSQSPIPTEPSQRCRSHPTAELFSHDETKSLIPPPPAYSASEEIIFRPRFGQSNCSGMIFVPPPPFPSPPLQDFRIPSPPPPPSPPPFCIIPPPPATSPPPEAAFLPVIPPPPMPALIRIIKQELDSNQKSLHIPIRPLPAQFMQPSKLSVKPKQKVQRELCQNENRVQRISTSSDEGKVESSQPEVVVGSNLNDNQSNSRDEKSGSKSCSDVQALEENVETEESVKEQARLRRLLFIAESSLTASGCRKRKHSNEIEFENNREKEQQIRQEKVDFERIEKPKNAMMETEALEKASPRQESMNKTVNKNSFESVEKTGSEICNLKKSNFEQNSGTTSNANLKENAQKSIKDISNKTENTNSIAQMDQIAEKDIRAEEINESGSVAQIQPSKRDEQRAQMEKEILESSQFVPNETASSVKETNRDLVNNRSKDDSQINKKMNDESSKDECIEEIARYIEESTPLKKKSKPSTSEHLIRQTVNDIIVQLDKEILDDNQHGGVDLNILRQECEIEIASHNFKTFLGEQICRDFRKQQERMHPHGNVPNAEQRSKEMRKIQQFEASNKSLKQNEPRKAEVRGHRGHRKDGSSNSKSMESTLKEKCLEQVQNKFKWFQWNQFYVTNDNHAVNLSQKEESKSREKNLKRKLVSENGETGSDDHHEDSDGSSGLSAEWKKCSTTERSTDISTDDNSRFEHLENLKRLRSKKTDKDGKLLVQVQNEDTSPIFDISRNQRSSRTSSADPASDGANRRREGEELVEGDLNSVSNVSGNFTAGCNSGQNKIAEKEKDVAGISQHDASDKVSQVEGKKDEMEEAKPESYVWKKRLLIGYQHQQETQNHENAIEVRQSLVAPAVETSVHKDPDSNFRKISKDADEEIQVISENRNTEIARLSTIKENLQRRNSELDVAVLPSGRNFPVGIRRPEFKTSVPPAMLLSNPEVEIIPLQTGSRSRHYCQRKTSYSLTKVAMSSKTCNQIHQQLQNFHSNSNQVIRLRNYRKIAIRPQMNPANVVPTVFYPPDMSARRFQHRPPALPMLPPIPMLEPIPVRRQHPNQINQFPPLQWISQTTSQPVVPKPVPQPVPRPVSGEASNQNSSQGSDKRDGSYYRSAKQFILTDDANNTFSLFAH